MTGAGIGAVCLSEFVVQQIVRHYQLPEFTRFHNVHLVDDDSLSAHIVVVRLDNELSETVCQIVAHTGALRCVAEWRCDGGSTLSPGLMTILSASLRIDTSIPTPRRGQIRARAGRETGAASTPEGS